MCITTWIRINKVENSKLWVIENTVRLKSSFIILYCIAKLWASRGVPDSERDVNIDDSLWCWRGSPSWGGTDGYESRKRSSPTSLSSLKDGGPWRWQKVRYLQSTWFTTPCEPRAKTTTTNSLCWFISLTQTQYRTLSITQLLIQSTFSYTNGDK